MTSPPRLSDVVRSASLWGLFIALETAAQVTLKLAAIDPNVWQPLPRFMPSFMGSMWFASSIGCDGANLLLWLAILRRHDLSAAVPLSSGTYLAVVAATWAFLNEPVSLQQVLGIVLISAGLILIAPSETGAEV